MGKQTLSTNKGETVTKAFFTEHPQYAKNDFYIPAFAARVHRGNKAKESIHINLKGFAIGNGLTDHAIHYKAYSDYALEMGIIQQSDYKNVNKMHPACELAIKLCDNPTMYLAMLMEWMRNLKVGIPALLEDGMKLLIYTGEYDLIFNCLDPSLDDHITNTEFYDDKQVHDVGHMVPMDQPKAGLEMLKRPSGSPESKFGNVQEYTRTKWKISGKCKLIPLGKGFFIIKLDNKNDKIFIWSHGPWIVEKMPMRLMPWSPFFSVDNHHNTNALIWYKFSGLPSELWSPMIILSLGKTLGTTIQLDQSTINHDYGYHASMLVDIDLSQPIPNHVFIDIEGKMINQEIILHRVPKFYNHCKNVGHCIVECKVIQRAFRGEKNQVSKNIKNTGNMKNKAKVLGDMKLGECSVTKGKRGRSESPKTNSKLLLRDTESTNKFHALSNGLSGEQSINMQRDLGMEEEKGLEDLNVGNSKGNTQNSKEAYSGDQDSPIEEVRKLLNSESWPDLTEEEDQGLLSNQIIRGDPIYNIDPRITRSTTESKNFVKGFRISRYNTMSITNENKDFNTVLRLSEKKGRKPPCRRAVAEFSDVIDAACLTESITTGVTFTWCNGQKG
ncbi:hypothetical protein GIB67_003911 [Kingdonia uniflora]|uniref:DUF4283 domain-containing protein n=1 Tax=Kingdonia uniflora TaxID=39325 RepID=A0A7J7LJV8_9MAGN|nr:hypothetical protein GIB67_003911 [Kingdonia uniflora]